MLKFIKKKTWRELIWIKSTRNKKTCRFFVCQNIYKEDRIMTREYRNFTIEKNKAVKMVLVEKKSQREVERTILGKRNAQGQ